MEGNHRAAQDRAQRHSGNGGVMPMERSAALDGKPRITLCLTTNGTLDIYLNEQGRELLVRELQHLSRDRDHFHFWPEGLGEVEVRSRPYSPSDKVIEYGKVLFRPDEWDRQYFPEVLKD
jgi:hypothetical protein